MRPSRLPFMRLVLTGLAVLLATWAASLIAVLAWERHDQARPASAIVVLGAAQYVGRPSPVLRARLDHAIDLWRRKLAPLMIVTGGTGRGDTTSEAAVSQRYAVQRGVPASAILL
jgi:vancomycin permeability regulator SanA